MLALSLALPLLLAEPAADAGTAPSPEAPEPSRSYLLPAGETFGLNLLVWGIARPTVGQQSDDWSISFPQVLTENPFRPWVWGKGGSSFDTSQFLHPVHGALEFDFARSAGLSFWESIWYPIGGSLMWELFMETNDPAINDEIVTPMGGVFLGEALHRFADVLRGPGPPDTWHEIAAFLVSPAEGINHLAFHDSFWSDLDHPVSGYLEASLGANVGGDYFDRVLGAASATPQAFVRLEASEYGIGGYRARRPFDDFDFTLDLAAGSGFSVHPAIDGNGEWDVFVRGLLVPARLDGGRAFQGLWGLWGTYDYGQPEVVRVSTVGLGPGATGQWDVARGVSLVGSAIAAWVPFASADAITAPMLERDY
ncbi:MAG TPA: DUF3943 domain-containing protein, partial [Myxococcales bacterium]|nr:DUF3943 domain-containing protein [Myxococcales bacterium]